MKILGQFENNTLPDIETERLYLRQRTLEDAPDLLAYGSLAEVANAAGFIPSQTLQDSIDFLTNWYNMLDAKSIPRGYGITLKGDNRVIGSIDFNNRCGNKQHILEMGYVLHPDYWGQGIIVEAAEALIAVTFQLLPDIQKISVSHYAFNQQSQRVIEKLGFTYEGRIRNEYVLHHQYYDSLVYGLLRQEWENNTAKMHS